MKDTGGAIDQLPKYEHIVTEAHGLGQRFSYRIRERNISCRGQFKSLRVTTIGLALGLVWANQRFCLIMVEGTVRHFSDWYRVPNG